MKRAMGLLRRLADERGSIAVEFALTVPLLIVIVVGLADFGRAFYDRMALETAARGAVQFARQYPHDIAGIRLAALNAGQLPAGVTVDVPAPFCECPNGASVGCGSACPSGEGVLRFLSVTVREDFETLFPYPGMPSPLPLTGSAVIRVQ